MYKTLMVMLLIVGFIILHGASTHLHKKYEHANCEYYLHQHPEEKSGPCWDAVEGERAQQASSSKKPNEQ